MANWCDEVNAHLDKKLEAQTEKDVDILDQIKQLDKLIAKQREMIIRSRSQFEDEFYCVKDFINEKCLLLVDQRLNIFHEVCKFRLVSCWLFHMHLVLFIHLFYQFLGKKLCTGSSKEAAR